MPPTTLTIGTRGSKLALWQAHWVKGELEGHHPGLTVKLSVIKTTGDKITDVPLAQVGGKGLFVKEIEEALLSRRVDLAVHSMKDVPTAFPNGLGLVVTTQREDARDALLSPNHASIDALPHGARVGTASLRRQAQLLARRPDLAIFPLRGNLDTRLKKLTTGEYDAILLACAGLTRLGWGAGLTHPIPLEECLPAIGQGALGIECRLDDTATRDAVAFLNHPESADAVGAERSLLQRLEGGCQVPIAAHGRITGEVLRLDALVGDERGTQIIRGHREGQRQDALALGTALADELLARGARQILAEFYAR
ncbi:MAG: hydroxymethylbilane synthase [Nitrospirae bacterium CG18_big_fil_WC_8_21_14_2_50_70_55]|nr:hydroxymethylbilane synthase [Deltaproteobacteria bacterium]OIP63636.1 MAG: hydroxymethylbilane synthase [Nitrospirae bacterium CG2_30_70_394]PIQ07194.1 MAG: hydroxymethylbilane synthase [Nitrospirae bacterium CG18_big_fil_WC_8_21_14_2_50_70_55]PIU77285.1 MAG: hydroxymethylbilane synthase [Nitrospirae bacterium CG06_land_8_20_14_3_00_70_43]PIW83653.1 MAG: hydroxymethylbilane synthase [Nitrospirae bacterium CG_4_8_14_3_um_filter_70_85]PIX83672.1 MAG: hydroxymethylbilane synthase [Nitrospirae